MKRKLAILWCGWFLLVLTTYGQTVVCDFEYANDQEACAKWHPTLATLQLCKEVPQGSKGTQCLRVERFFSSNSNQIETITGPVLEQPVSIGSNQVLLIYARTDVVTNSLLPTLTVYAQDAAGKVCWWKQSLWNSTNWMPVKMPCLAAITQEERPDMQKLQRFFFEISFEGAQLERGFVGNFWFDDLIIATPPKPPGGLRVISN